MEYLSRAKGFQTSFRLFCFATIVFGLSSCGRIEHETQTRHSYNVKKTVGIGDAVYSDVTRKSLPNIFGKADIWGRTTSTGRTTVIYGGIRNGHAVFTRSSVKIETGATTMNSSGPLIIPNSGYSTHSGTVSGSGGTAYYSGSSRTSLPPTVIPIEPPKPVYMPEGQLNIFLNVNELPAEFIVEGTTIIVTAADELSATVELVK